MEAHPTLGCIQDQNSWGWVLGITIRSCVNFSVLTALFLHSFGGNRTGLLGLDPVCTQLPATPGSSLWSSEEGPTTAHTSLCSQTLGQRMWEENESLHPPAQSPRDLQTIGALSVSRNLSWNPGKGPLCSSQ